MQHSCKADHSDPIHRCRFSVADGPTPRWVRTGWTARIQDKMQLPDTTAVLGTGQRSDRWPFEAEAEVLELREIEIRHPRLDPCLSHAAQRQVQCHQLLAAVVHALDQHGCRQGRISNVGTGDSVYPQAQSLQVIPVCLKRGMVVLHNNPVKETNQKIHIDVTGDYHSGRKVETQRPQGRATSQRCEKGILVSGHR